MHPAYEVLVAQFDLILDETSLHLERINLRQMKPNENSLFTNEPNQTATLLGCFRLSSFIMGIMNHDGKG